MFIDTRNYSTDSASDYNTMDIDDQRKLLIWIRSNVLSRKTPNRMHTSYGMKHVFERLTGIYVTNGQFKGAMQVLGFLPVNVQDRNWCFRISERSPAFALREG